MTKKTFLTFLALNALVFNATAQQSIERLVDKYNDHSLIRKIDNGEWIVASQDDLCSFSRVIDGTTNVDVLSLPDGMISVSDFEIYGNRVYLCGLTNNDASYLAYFDLYTFPTSPVFCIYLDGIDTVNKLEVIPYKTGIGNPLCQVIMTGEDSIGQGVIVDAVPAYTGWDIYYLWPYHNSLHPFLDDIAVIDDYIIVTYYDCKDNYLEEKCTNGILYFSMPTTPITPLNLSSIQGRTLPFGTSVPFLAKKVEGNTFVTATKKPNGDEIYVSRYWGLNIYGTARLLLTENYILKDIACDVDDEFPEETGIEVMTHYPYCNETYRVIPSMFSFSGLAYGHVYAAGIFSSLIYQGNYSNRYIATGCNEFGDQRLYLFRFTAGLYPIECLEYSIIETIPLDKDMEPISFSMEYNEKKNVFNIQIPHASETTIKSICEESYKQ